MNIQEAKEEIIRTIRAYTKKNPDGTPRIPTEKQRPVLLIGPPGIGKTAIMKQIAEEIGCGLVAYSMTHHTRQSAIGLPFISEKEYGGKKWSVTEYTMSEIVASVYDYMHETGKKSGILFLDEINCVSETLTPVMLQLLQNKTFGNVPIPENWIIVTAGNPPEYNKSVREFDMVTLDRVKNIEVEADLAIWQKYALQENVHPAVRTYLTVYPDHFYRITDTDRGQLFVTARGWEDLSLMLKVYEEDGITVDEKWFLQYLQDDDIARSFGLYYDLFRAFYQKDMTDGKGMLAQMLLADPEKLAKSTSTECLSIAAMLFHQILSAAEEAASKRALLDRRKGLPSLLPPDEQCDAEEDVRTFFEQKRKAVAIRVGAGIMKPDEEFREKTALGILEKDASDWRKLPEEERGRFSAYEALQIEKEEALILKAYQQISDETEEAYTVLQHCPQGRSALLYLTTDLSGSEACTAALEAAPSASYSHYRSEL